MSDERLEHDVRGAVDAVVAELDVAPEGVALAPVEEAPQARPLAPWAERFVRFFDDGVRIPGTEQGIGVDPILGLLLPGAGDAITGVGSASLLLLALRERVPGVVIGRMVLNIGVDVLLGALPVLGDVFDIFWRSNRRNLDLIHAHRRPGAKASPLDYAIVGVGLAMATLSIVMPVVMIYVLGVSFAVALRSLLGG